MSKSEDQKSEGRIDHLDSIRFIAALWVVLSHGALLPKSSFANQFGQLIASTYGVSFDGISAVMIFFIVSGFCIHLPYVNVNRLPVTRFLVRRYVRIGMPLTFVLVMIALIGGQASERGHAVLWSVYAELIYYTLYPGLFFAATRFGWRMLIACSGATSIALVLLHINYTYVWQFGWLTWLWGLPIWLSGCALAERYRSGKITKVPSMLWYWRLAIWGLSIAALIGVFHSKIPVGYPISMLVFSLFGYSWIAQELGNVSPAWKWLEACGRGSYSLYLIHAVVLGAIADHLSQPLSPILFPFMWSAIGIATYLFYRLVERPSHQLARRFAEMLRKRAANQRLSEQRLLPISDQK